MKKTMMFIVIAVCSLSCSKVSVIDPGTFEYGGKIYKVMDNQVTQIADLKEDVPIIQSTQGIKKSYPDVDLSYIKDHAKARIEGLFRGSHFYFKLYIINISDLRENYTNGSFTIALKDKDDFDLQQVEINSVELTRTYNGDGEIAYFQYNGKIEMSPAIFSAVQSISIASSVRLK